MRECKVEIAGITVVKDTGKWINITLFEGIALLLRSVVVVFLP